MSYSVLGDCPLPTTLDPIPQDNCPVKTEQIVRLALRFRKNVAFTESSIKLLATWTPLMTADDETLILISPIFTGFEIPVSEGNYTGGNDNSTFNGIREYNGENTVPVAASFKNISSATQRALDKLTPHSIASAVGVTNLEAFFINRFGIIISNNFDGFPIYNFRIGTRGSAGLNANDVIPFAFDLEAYWDRNAVYTKPAFDPLTELSNS